MHDDTHPGPPPPVTIRRAASAADEALVNAWYRAVDFTPTQLGKEQVLLAERGGVPVGAGRLVPLDGGEVELGGMYVDAAHRGGGVASALVRALVQEAGARTVWCIPFAHLVGFYASFGLQPADVTAAPPAIRAKLRWCSTTYAQATTLLVRRGGLSSDPDGGPLPPA